MFVFVVKLCFSQQNVSLVFQGKITEKQVEQIVDCQLTGGRKKLHYFPL
jgi:hypothetical protein